MKNIICTLLLIPLMGIGVLDASEGNTCSVEKLTQSILENECFCFFKYQKITQEKHPFCSKKTQDDSYLYRNFVTKPIQRSFKRKAEKIRNKDDLEKIAAC